MEQYRKKGTSIIACTIPGKDNNNGIKKAIDLTKLKNVNCSNIKDRINRESVQSITSKLISYLQNLKEIPPFGLVLYIGVFGKNESVQIIDIPLSEKIEKFTYNCDTSVDFGPIQQLTKSKNIMLFVITDGQGIRIWCDIQGTQTKEYQEDYYIVKFQNHGGQSQNRFLHTAQNNKHQQVTNSIDKLLNVIRAKNRVFDSLFVCGNQEFRKEVISGIKDSDLISRIKQIHDITIGLDSTNINTIQELKSNISNISELIAEDTIYSEQKYVDMIDQHFIQDTCTLQFGLDSLFENINASNVKQIVINEHLDLNITIQQAYDFDIENYQQIYGDRDSLQLIELLLNIAIEQKKIDLAIIQSTHVQSTIQKLGGFFIHTKY